MLSKNEEINARKKAIVMLEKINIALTEKERENVEIADFGLDNLANIGLEIVTYVNNDKYCAKELVMFPYQTCPQHRHPPIEKSPGKQETFRVRWGTVYLYAEGEGDKSSIKAKLPKGKEECFTVFNEIILNTGEQYTLSPDTWHWFQSGAQGAIVSEFSTTSDDLKDIFIDKEIKRIPD